MKAGIKRVLQGIAIAGLLCAAPASFAQKIDNQPVLQKLVSEGGTVTFLGNAYGLDGWLLTSAQGKVQYAYTTPQGALLIGMLFSPEGVSETQKQLMAYKKRTEGAQESVPGAEKSASKSEKMYADTEKSSWVALGNSGAPYLYMFVNVSCDHCQMFWKDLEPSVKEGKLQVRMVPFGTTEVNRDGAAALLSVEDPAAAWQAYLNGDKTALGKEKIKEGAYLKADANTALAQAWKAAAGPPYTLYRRLADGKVTAIVGRPDNTLLLQADFLK